MRIFCALLLLVLPLTACDSGPQVSWQKFEENTLTQALQSSQPTLVYFYAAWCRPCQQMRSTTFRDEQVVKSLDGWNRLKADMSFREDKKTIERTDQFQIGALPAIFVYDKHGELVAKLFGYVSRDRLLEIVASQT